MDHPGVDRFLIRDILLSFSQSATTNSLEEEDLRRPIQVVAGEAGPDFQLGGRVSRHSLCFPSATPDRAQFSARRWSLLRGRFLYEREGLKGAAVFVDGPHHDEEARKQKDTRERKKLGDLGYLVIVIRYDSNLEAQILRTMSIYGPGIRAAGKV